MLGMELTSLYCKQRISIVRLLSHKWGICLTARAPEAQRLSQNKGQKDGMGRDAGGCEWNSGFWTC